MQIVYDKLFTLLKENNITQKDIKEDLKFSNSIFDKLRNNGFVTTETLGKLCEYLHCTPNDIMEIKFDEETVQIYDTKRKKKTEIRKQIAELQAKLKQ